MTDIAKKLRSLFFTCWACAMLSLLFLVDGQNEIGKTMAIGFTLGGMVTGFGWFAVLIWNRFYRE
jgi:hypothetical protein